MLCNPWGNFCQHECREYQRIILVLVKLSKGLLLPWNVGPIPFDRIVEGRRQYDIDFEVGDIWDLPLFDCYRNDPVCYEITFGCVYNCNFCSLRRIWNAGVCSHRSVEVVRSDLKRLANRQILKIIDDDICSHHIS